MAIVMESSFLLFAYTKISSSPDMKPFSVRKTVWELFLKNHHYEYPKGNTRGSL